MWKNGLAINHIKSVLLPEEGRYVNFQNFKRLAKASFIIYVDFEFVLITSSNSIDSGPNTKKHQDHIVWSYCYKLLYVNEGCSKTYKTYFSEDATENCLIDIIKESEYCSKVIETEFNKLLVMIGKDNKGFNNSANCWISKKLYEEGEVKVTGKCHWKISKICVWGG